MRDVNHLFFEPGSHEREQVMIRIGASLNRVSCRFVNDCDIFVVEYEHRIESVSGVL